MKNNVCAEVTQTVIDAIEGGMTDGEWVRPWVLTSDYPMNASTGKFYQGMNALLLMMIGGGHYAGYGQWKQKEAQVQKGEKGTMILAPMFGRKDAKGDKPLIGFRSVKVFSASQVEGYTIPEAESFDHDPVTRIEAIIEATGADITHGGNRACYIPSLDHINMPIMSQFRNLEDYYSTMLHELAHWTGAATRLDRKLNNDRFGVNNSYAFEELVAELTASFLCAELRIKQIDMDSNHVKYISNWLTIMKGDDKAIMHAAGLAQKAANYILKCGEVSSDEVDDAVAA